MTGDEIQTGVPEEKHGSVMSVGKGVLWVISRAHKKSTAAERRPLFAPSWAVRCSERDVSWLPAALPVETHGKVIWVYNLAIYITKATNIALHVIYRLNFSFCSDLVRVNMDVNGRGSGRGPF